MISESITTGMNICWGSVLAYWTISGFRAKKARAKESISVRFVQYWLPLIIAFLLLGPGDWFGHTWLRDNFVWHTNLVGLIGLSLCITGAALACWSRYTLGKNWSVSVQQKEGHELVDTGIYGIVRHPIYTGLLLLFTGNAVIVGDYRGIIAVLVVFISFWFKIRKEEQIMLDTFGSQYEQYRSRTKALIPFVF